MSEISSKRQVTKNAIMLYVRMFFSMIVGLFSSRVILNTLGVADYGIYNVVGNIVPIFGFLSNAMAGSISRFITYELGKGNIERLKRTFSSAIIVQLSIALIIFILGEVVGLWFVNAKLVIPSERLYAANCILQFSIVSILLNIIQVPYNACIIAHEKMGVYAYIEILNVILKLLILYILVIGGFDKLILYGLLSLIVSIIIMSSYRIYSIRKFEECHFKFVLDKDILKSMLTFSGYDLYGNICLTAKFQGIPFIINLFFGVVMNAAVGIVYTVTNVFRSFCGNILTAFRPQIVKNYAQENYTDMSYMINLSIRMLLMLSILIVVILIYNSQIVLELWLGKVPPMTSILLNIALIENLFALLAESLRIGINATGKIKGYSFWNGTSLLLVIPFSYIALKFDSSPDIVFYISLISQIGCSTISLYYLKKVFPQYSVVLLFKILFKVIFPLIVVLVFLFFIDFNTFPIFLRLLYSVGTIFFLYFVSAYFTLAHNEKLYIKGYLYRKLGK